jgi:hypothetical protein
MVCLRRRFRAICHLLPPVSDMLRLGQPPGYLTYSILRSRAMINEIGLAASVRYGRLGECDQIFGRHIEFIAQITKPLLRNHFPTVSFDGQTDYLVH